MNFTVYGEPKAKGRPRFSRTGSHISTYTPKETTNYENLVKLSFYSQVEDRYIIQGNVKAKITAYFTIPKSTSKKKKIQMLADAVLPTKKPDTDNIAKIILDSLNGIAFNDDAQVTDLIVAKRYSEEPRVEVELLEI